MVSVKSLSSNFFLPGQETSNLMINIKILTNGLHAFVRVHVHVK